MVARLPGDRKQALLSELQTFQGIKKCTKRQLLSLIGRLSFACKVVPAGRIFLRRLIDLSTTVKNLHHHIRLTVQAREDIAWWLDFLPQWSGSSKLLEPTWQPSPDMQLFTDASSLGNGAYWSGRWIQGDWSRAQTHYDIAWKELYAIVAACNVWGNAWAGRRILFHCDNESIVLTWKKGTSRSPSIMCLVRALYWVAVSIGLQLNFSFMCLLLILKVHLTQLLMPYPVSR